MSGNILGFFVTNYALNNGARGPYKETFGLTFNVYGQEEVRTDILYSSKSVCVKILLC